MDVLMALDARETARRCGPLPAVAELMDDVQMRHDHWLAHGRDLVSTVRQLEADGADAETAFERWVSGGG